MENTLGELDRNLIALIVQCEKCEVPPGSRCINPFTFEEIDQACLVRKVTALKLRAEALRKQRKKEENAD